MNDNKPEIIAALFITAFYAGMLYIIGHFVVKYW